MGHVFISYSHQDSDYAHALAANLQDMGFEAWIDERLDYGSQWPHELQKQLDGCSAFILIMSPRSYASEWVQSELQRAKRKVKPIFPLLLEGDEPWLSVESTQYYDVRGRKFPDEKFYTAIAHAVSSPEGQSVQLPVEVKKPVKSSSPSNPSKLKTGIVLAIIGGFGVVAILVATVVLMNGSGLSGTSVPPPAAPLVSPSATNSSTDALIPNPTSTAASKTLVVTNAPDAADSADFIDSKGVSMHLVPAGNFTMGSDSGDVDEVPIHNVYLAGFYIDEYEVTNARYRACVTANVCYQPKDINYYGNSQYADHPVIYVDWNMAKTYCEWRGAKLPTEAQWEKAARGIDKRTYPWGEGIDCSKANYLGCSGGTSNVTTYQSGMSPYGVYDMAGNVWEWVADWYSQTYYQDSPMENPTGPNDGSLKVVRGGAWNMDYVYGSLRNAKAPSVSDNDIGFRCAMDATP